jgi:DNA-binding transcriptional ArsR family regulator/ElaB/YqjD/DUF883 family membrane-anchored ribosome-binding protein
MSSSDRTGVSVALVAAVAAWLLLGAVVGAPATAASDAATPEDDDGLLNETSDTVDETTETTEDTVEDTTDTTEEAVDGITDATDDATDTTEDAVNDTTDTVVEETTETTEETESTVEDTTGESEPTATVGAAAADLGAFATERTTSLVDTTETVTADLVGTAGDTTAMLTGSGDLVTSTDADTAEDDSTTAPSDGTDDGAAATTFAARDGPIDDGASNDVGTAGTADTGGDDAPGGATAGGAGGPLTLLGVEELPVGGDTAAGGTLAALLVGAAGVAVRQGSALGGTGTGTAALRAAAARAGEGPLSRLVRVLSVFRYSRYDDSDPLELDARRDVYEAISTRPGDPITAVSDRAEVNLSTARHHVKVLGREGLVATARVRNCERFYPAGTDDLELAAAMADEATADILDALVRLEPASVSGLADEVDRSPSTVTHHLQKLAEDDIVVRERAGRAVENKLSEPARAALDPETERRRHAAEQRLDPDSGAEAASGAGAD